VDTYTILINKIVLFEGWYMPSGGRNQSQFPNVWYGMRDDIQTFFWYCSSYNKQMLQPLHHWELGVFSTPRHVNNQRQIYQLCS
jgi:hypothetical protein